MVSVTEKPKQGLARIGEAAVFLSVSKSYMYKLVEAQAVPVRRIGNALRIPWAWLEKQASADVMED